MAAKVINLFAPPGVGKSTTAAGLFYKLKQAGVNAEMAREYAKDLVWSYRLNTLEDQLYVFGKQHHKLYTLKDVDVILTDSPLIMQLIYAQRYPECFRQTVKWAFDQYDNKNYLLTRTKPYNPKGRTQTLEQSDALYGDIMDVLTEYEVSHKVTTGDENGLNFIYEDIIKDL